MSKHLSKVLTYFAFFSYFPTESEIHTFLPTKITKKDLHVLLSNECKQHKIVRLPINKYFRASDSSTLNLNLDLKSPRYTLPQYSTAAGDKFKSQIQIQSKKSRATVSLYIKILKLLPLVRFIGITGKSAVEGVKNNDDIDLFIVTKNRYVWTTRFFVVLIAKLLRIHGGTGVCLNLFFDKNDLIIPKKKQNEYIAHELLQLKPIVDKENIYSALVEANRWIFAIFPNGHSIDTKKVIIDCPASSPAGMTQRIENFFKLIQLPIINRNKVSFLITPTQLWLFRYDFEVKLKRKGVRKVL